MSKPDFTADQMHAIDRGVVKAYIKTRAILPADLLGAGKGDPAGALRSYAYEYALTHRHDIESREAWEISHHVYGRVMQYARRVIRGRMEQPYGVGAGFDRAVADIKRLDRMPRPSPPRKVFPEAPHETPVMLDMLDRYGRYIPADKLQFVVKYRRKGEPVYETPENMASLHTRKPTRMEFWQAVCSETDRKAFRVQIAQAFADGICDCADC